jgi:hypothetical protein
MVSSMHLFIFVPYVSVSHQNPDFRSVQHSVHRWYKTYQRDDNLARLKSEHFSQSEVSVGENYSAVTYLARGRGGGTFCLAENFLEWKFEENKSLLLFLLIWMMLTLLPLDHDSSHAFSCVKNHFQVVIVIRIRLVVSHESTDSVDLFPALLR